MFISLMLMFFVFGFAQKYLFAKTLEHFEIMHPHFENGDDGAGTRRRAGGRTRGGRRWRGPVSALRLEGGRCSLSGGCMISKCSNFFANKYFWANPKIKIISINEINIPVPFKLRSSRPMTQKNHSVIFFARKKLRQTFFASPPHLLQCYSAPPNNS